MQVQGVGQAVIVRAQWFLATELLQVGKKSQIADTILESAPVPRGLRQGTSRGARLITLEAKW